jgi:hypothetical protein
LTPSPPSNLAAACPCLPPLLVLSLQGYIRLARNLGEEGQCGIAMQASFPIKKGPNPPEPPPEPPGPGPVELRLPAGTPYRVVGGVAVP